jgi:hypothetical protein
VNFALNKDIQISKKNFLKKNKQYLLLNRNLLVSIVSAMAISSITSQIFLANIEHHLNVSYTIIISYATYYTVFGVLYYHDNKQVYILEGRGIDKIKLRKDIVKVLLSVGIAEIVYVLIRWLLQHYLLTIGYEPYLSSITAHAISAIIFAMVVNLGARRTRLFDKGRRHEEAAKM